MCSSVSECCICTPTSFLLSALLGVLSGLLKAFIEAISLVPERLLLRGSRDKEIMASAEVKKLNRQRRRAAGHSQSVRSKIPGFQVEGSTDVEDSFTGICCWLITCVSSLMAALWRGTGNAINPSMALLREILEAFEIELTDTTARI